MTKRNIITWGVLMILTVIAGLVSSASIPFLIPIILLLACLKIMGVTFSFMEMRKANPFWKVLIVGYLILFCGITLIALGMG